MNTIDAITIGAGSATPVELTASPVWQYQWESVYSGIRFAKEDESIKRLRKLRVAMLEQWEEQQLPATNPRLGDWRLKILDTTDYQRPKTQTVKLVYAHSAEGMKRGHNLSILSQVAAEGSWALPLEIAVIEVGKNPGEFGAQQVVEYVQRFGWQPDEVLALDAYYTKAPYLRPMHDAGVNILGRVAANRVFYLEPPPYPGRGRPAKKGRKIKLNDGRTLPEPDQHQRVELADGKYCGVSCYCGIRMKKWLGQPFVLYRVIEYRADGSQKYRRPLWLIFVPAQEEIAAPAPAQAQALYSGRFSIEHSIRFMKSELGLDAGQFNGDDAIARVALWVELVAMAFWQLFLLKSLVNLNDNSLPRWWRVRRASPGAVRRLALAIFVKFGIGVEKPKLRGKSPGRATGTRFAPRKRFRIFRRRKRTVTV